MKFGQDNKYKVIVHNTTYLSVLEILKMVMPFVALPYLISTVGADGEWKGYSADYVF